MMPPPTLERSRRGGALLLAVITLVSVSGIALAVLRVSSATTNRLRASVDEKKAFYAAEAGIAVSYRGLVGGTTGQIGSMEAPALFGGGLVWVDVEELEDGRISLTSTAMYGSGRESLQAFVEPIEVTLGIFSEQDLVIDQSLLLDGYDSTSGTYQSETQLEVIDVKGTSHFVYTDFDFLETDGMAYNFDPTQSPGKTLYACDYSIPVDVALAMGMTYASQVRAYFDDILAGNIGPWRPEAESGGGPAVLGPTTGGGGLLGSNGNVDLGSWEGAQVELYGDIQPGPESSVELGGNAVLTGEVTPRTSFVELPPVKWPNLELLPALVQGSPIPVTIPASRLGYESIVVEADSELWVTGPATLAVRTLELQPGASLVLDNTDGPVDLIVLDGARLEAGSLVSVASRDPGNLSLRVAGSGEVELASTSQFYGIVYAPEATVVVGSAFEIYGALVGQALDLAANVRIHFDSGFSARNALPKLLSWRIDEVPTAVAQSRIDPFVLLGLDQSELGTMDDSQETNSWFFETTYLDIHGVVTEYNGPFEDLPLDDIQDIYTAKFKKPTAKGVGEWVVDIEYLCDKGHIHDYSGALSDFKLNNHPTNFVKLRINPPADL